ncbi:MAG: hypothetical protein ACM3KR_07965 [Deltaproteobacteria bacterium]
MQVSFLTGANVATNVFVAERYLPDYFWKLLPKRLTAPFGFILLDLPDKELIGRNAYEALENKLIFLISKNFTNYCCNDKKLVERTLNLLPDSIIITARDFYSSCNCHKEAKNFFGGKKEFSVKELKIFMDTYSNYKEKITNLLIYKFAEWYLPIWFDQNKSDFWL